MCKIVGYAGPFAALYIVKSKWLTAAGCGWHEFDLGLTIQRHRIGKPKGENLEFKRCRRYGLDISLDAPPLAPLGSSEATESSGIWFMPQHPQFIIMMLFRVRSWSKSLSLAEYNYIRFQIIFSCWHVQQCQLSRISAPTWSPATSVVYDRRAIIIFTIIKFPWLPLLIRFLKNCHRLKLEFLVQLNG